MKIPRLSEVSVRGKRLLIREDLNAPISDGEVTSDARLIAALPTIEYAFAQGAACVLLASHLGRPPEGADPESAPEFSLGPIAKRLEALLGREVLLIEHIEDALDLKPGCLGLLENVRFLPGETDNEPELGYRLARLCDVFVMDAFATAHRAHASTVGIIDAAEIACAGPLLVRELEALEQLLENPARPFVAVIGGAKISSKLGVLDRLAELTDSLVVGGAIATTFLAAAGKAVGQSLIEASMLDEAKRLYEKYHPLLRDDCVVTEDVREGVTTHTVPVDNIPNWGKVADIGPVSRARLAKTLKEAGTILWNGPLGVFEIGAFSAGTLHLARCVAESPAFSVAGGGDTLAAIEMADVGDSISYISTGGGALLEFVEGRELPAIASLRARAR